MKKVIYTCDICGNIMEEPKETFTFPIQVGYYTSNDLIATPNPPRIITKTYMLCRKCQQDIANHFLDRGIISN